MKYLLLLPLLFLLPHFAHADIRAASGTYTGTGTGASQTITVSPSFPIKYVIVKATTAEPTSDGADGSASSVPAGNAFNLFQNSTLISTSITAVGTGQFTVAASNIQNHSGTVYSYIAIGGSDFFTSSYTGNASTQTISAPGFLPSGVAFVKGTGGTVVVGNFGHGNTDSSSFFTSAQGNLTGRITALLSNGFSVGNNSEVNTSATTYYYGAYPAVAGYATSGSYTGSGSTKSITGLGFQPDIVIIKGNNTQEAIMKSSNGTTGTNSLPFTANVAQITTGITSLDSDGFSLGNSSLVNTGLTTYYYMAFKDNPPPVSASFLGLVQQFWL